MKPWPTLLANVGVVNRSRMQTSRTSASKLQRRALDTIMAKWRRALVHSQENMVETSIVSFTFLMMAHDNKNNTPIDYCNSTISRINEHDQTNYFNMNLFIFSPVKL